MDAQFIAALFGAGGVGSIVLVLINGLLKHLDGSAGREQRKSADAIAQRDQAWARMTELESEVAAARRDMDAAHRMTRLVKEYASLLRGLMHEHGLKPPPWPTTTCPDPDDKE